MDLLPPTALPDRRELLPHDDDDFMRGVRMYEREVLGLDVRDWRILSSSPDAFRAPTLSTKPRNGEAADEH